jgi:putative transposase
VVQIIALLHEAETAATKAEVYRKYGISEQTYHRWRQLYGGLDVPHLRRLKRLEAENARLKRLVAEQMLANSGFVMGGHIRTFRNIPSVTVSVAARGAQNLG